MYISRHIYLLVCIWHVYTCMHNWILHVCVYMWALKYMYIHMWKIHGMCIQTHLTYISFPICMCISISFLSQTTSLYWYLQISYYSLFLMDISNGHYYPFEIQLGSFDFDSFRFGIFLPSVLIFSCRVYETST